jgi:hypothetical protein
LPIRFNSRSFLLPKILLNRLPIMIIVFKTQKIETARKIPED